MPQDGQVRRSSLVFPIALILIGVLFFAANWNRDFDPFRVIWTYWPILLILLGLGKIYDRTRARQDPTVPPTSSTGGIVTLLIVILVLAAIFGHGRGRGFHWNRDRDHGWDRDRESFSSDTQHQSQNVEKQNAKSVHTEIEMGAGQLNLQGGSSHLLEAKFDYRNTSQPHIEYKVEGSEGQLKITQEGGSHFIGRSENTWDLNFANDIPMTMEVSMGAGQGNLHLRDLNLSKLELNIGAGQVNIDLTGERKTDLQAEVNGGAGEADIRLPKNVGVIVDANGLIGSVDTHGLKHENGRYTNDAYGKSPVTIHLQVNGAVGRIHLEQE